MSALPVDLLVDTGASHTIIREDVLSSLGLPVAGARISTTPSTMAGDAPAHYLTYLVRVTVPGGLGFDEVREIVAMPLAGAPYEGILGRDILSKALLVYDGKAGAFKLTF